MLQYLMIAIGGAVGALLRFGLSNGVHKLLGFGFFYGTLTVNVIGSFALGLVYIHLFERMDLGPEWKGLIVVGLLGSLTTFSTFSLETMHFIEDGQLIKAGLNVLANVLLCLFGCFLGMLIARQL